VRWLLPAAALLVALAPGCCGGESGGRTRRPPPPPPDLAPARDAYRDGLSYYGKAKPGSRGERRNLSEASKRFRRSLDLIDGLKKSYPKDRRVEDLRLRVARLYYACMKRTTL
jgi:hypothetical protein